MESLTLRKSTWWFLTGAALVNTVVFSFILLCLSFILGYGLAAWQFPLAFILSILLNYFAARYFLPGDHQRVFIRSSVATLLVIVVSILVSEMFYDISADGQMYHMETAIQMKAGWNPFKQQLPLELNQAIWLNHYGKGAEGSQATIYALTHLLETTKATNFFLAVGSFCLVMAFLIRLDKFSWKKNLFFSFLLAFNPVTVYQLTNTYLDGQLCSFLLCFVAIGCLLYKDGNRYYLFLLSSVIILLINMKFTALVFACLFTGGMLLIFAIARKWQTFKRTLVVSALSSVFAVGVVGYFPYMINILQFHDILYPGLPMLKSEAGKFTPPLLKNKNQLSKFCISFFSHTDNFHLTSGPVIKYKVPFTFSKSDIFNASKPYVVIIAGMGPFFSGIFLVSAAIFMFWLWRLKDKREALPVFFLSGTLMVSVLIISEAWYARYVPQLWFIPVILLMASESEKGKWVRYLRNAMYLVMVVNLSFSFISFPYVFFKTQQIKYELRQLKASGETIPVEFTYFTSNRARFKEFEIPYREVSIPDSTATFMSSSSTKIIPPATMPDLPKSMVLRFGNKIEKKFHL